MKAVTTILFISAIVLSKSVSFADDPIIRDEDKRFVLRRWGSDDQMFLTDLQTGRVWHLLDQSSKKDARLNPVPFVCGEDKKSFDPDCTKLEIPIPKAKPEPPFESLDKVSFPKKFDKKE